MVNRTHSRRGRFFAFAQKAQKAWFSAKRFVWLRLAFSLLRSGRSVAEASSWRTGVEEQLQPSMQRFQRIAITAVFTLTCFTVPVLNAATLKEAASDEKGSGQVQPPGGSGSVTKGAVTEIGGPGASGVKAGAVQTGNDKGKGGAPATATAVGSVQAESVTTVPRGSLSQADGNSPPVTRPDWAAGTPIAEQVKQITEQFRREQQDLLDRYRELLKKAKDPNSDERDKMREQLRKEWDKLRDELISKQKDLRDAIRRQYEEFKVSHPDHQDLIEAAKERAKDRLRQRRGHSGD